MLFALLGFGHNDVAAYKNPNLKRRIMNDV